MGNGRTFRALSWVFGFLLPMRFLRDRMASLGATLLDLMTSEISRFSAISSLKARSLALKKVERRRRTPHKLLLVALSICSSRAELAEEDHQLIITRCALVGREAALGERSEPGAVMSGASAKE